MARRVFFSFHYERDVWRANVVRNSWVAKPDREEAGFIDAAEFEKLQRQGDEAVKRWINSQIDGTSVTAVLIGYETYMRQWVRYEIVKSFDKGNGQLGIYIHKIKDKNGYTDYQGQNPFEYLMLSIDTNGSSKYYEWNGSKWILFDKYPYCSRSFDQKYWGRNYQFSKMYNIYDWVDNDGFNNLGDWVEKAAKDAGR
ncbi:MAG: TIR domain-containing protein [Candidatus Nanoarchaeia archaeon]